MIGWPLWSNFGSSDAKFLGVHIWGDSLPRPLIWFALNVVKPVVYDFKWWLLHRIHPNHRYHVVKTGLTPGYYDQDTLILNSAMALLCDWVECMGGEDKLRKFTEELKTDNFSRQANNQQEALEIYHWWKVQRPADLKLEEELLMKAYDGRFEFEKVEGTDYSRMVFPEQTDEIKSMREQHREIEDKIAKDEQNMLHRLIDIRQGLWT